MLLRSDGDYPVVPQCDCLSLLDHDDMTDNSELAGLQALVADVGSGNVIDAELLEGCSVQAHELDEMDEDQAACVAAHCFSVLFDHNVQQIRGASADAATGVWIGSVDGFGFTISRDDLGDLVLDFHASDR